jgi:hypothetical protein
LKNVTDRCDRLSVTLTFSSRSTSRSGDGKKSSTILTRPISPLLYLTVGFFIHCLSLPPVPGSENPDSSVSPCEAYRHDGAFDLAKTEVTSFVAAMVNIFGNDARRVEKCVLSELEPYFVLGLINPVLGSIPFEIGHPT